MKIQCDVCTKNEASLFCTADEAVLCDGCDHRVHRANKLASKHQRFSLLTPSSSAKQQHPLCDLCQERRGFMFCKQDRAILCKECDFPIHSANEHTQKHDRFLLTGVKLSNTATTASDSNSNLVSSSVSSSATTLINNDKVAMEGSGSTTSTSSISQYLIETLPGWQVEDFLDPSSVTVPFGFSKGDDMLPLFDADGIEFEGNNNLGSMGMWVPQAPSPPPLALYSSQIIVNGVIGANETKEATNINIKGSSNRSRLRNDNNYFTVPQISPDSNSKRPRYLW